MLEISETIRSMIRIDIEKLYNKYKDNDSKLYDLLKDHIVLKYGNLAHYETICEIINTELLILEYLMGCEAANPEKCL